MTIIKTVALQIPAVRRLHGARNSLLIERNALKHEQDVLRNERDAAKGDEAVAISLRDAAVNERMSALSERDVARNEWAMALSQCEEMRYERDAAIDERDDLATKLSLIFIADPDRSFDHYASLGYDCEVGFQIKRVLSRNPSGFFTWNVSTPESIISLLDSGFANLLEKENITPAANGAMAHDASHDFYFHHEFDQERFKDSEDFDRKLAQLRGKFSHFVEGFKNRAASQDRTVYFYKCISPNGRDVALGLHKALVRYHGRNPFHLVMLQTEDRSEPDWDIPGLSNRYLRRFAPHYDATDAHVESWDFVFREFPRKGGMKLADYNVF